MRDLELRLDSLQDTQAMTHNVLQELLDEFRQFRGGQPSTSSARSQSMAGPLAGPSTFSHFNGHSPEQIKTQPDSPMSTIASPMREASTLPRPSSVCVSFIYAIVFSLLVYYSVGWVYIITPSERDTVGWRGSTPQAPPH